MLIRERSHTHLHDMNALRLKGKEQWFEARLGTVTGKLSLLTPAIQKSHLIYQEK